MDNVVEFEIWKTQLLNHVTSAKEIVESIKELDEIKTNLNNKAKELNKIAEELNQYAKALEAKIIESQLNTLEKAVNKLTKDGLITCKEMLMRLITVNLPEQLTSKMLDEKIFISQYILGNKNRAVLTDVCTIHFVSYDKGVIQIEVQFNYYPKSNKVFNLSDFKKMYSVVEYIILVLGFGKTL